MILIRLIVTDIRGILKGIFIIKWV